MVGPAGLPEDREIRHLRRQTCESPVTESHGVSDTLANRLRDLARDVRRIGCGLRSDPEAIAIAKDVIAAELAGLARRVDGGAALPFTAKRPATTAIAARAQGRLGRGTCSLDTTAEARALRAGAR